MSATKETPESLTLRAPPRSVTRLNRRTIATAAGVLAALVLGATLWSLEPQRRAGREAPVELHNTDRVAHAEGLAQLPGDYSKIAHPMPAPSAPPALGSPLPGDLGNALQHAEVSATDSPTLRADPAADAARAERISRQREAEEAAKATLFFRSPGALRSIPRR